MPPESDLFSRASLQALDLLSSPPPAVLSKGLPSGGARARASLAEERGPGSGANSDLPSSPELPGPSLGDQAVLLLHAAAEVEHALMVQYLYAAWSLDGSPGASDATRAARQAILQVAREEMAHLLSVQNALRVLGAPLNFERQDFPFRSALYPFHFRLEPLGRGALARFVLAELPDVSEVLVPPALLADLRRHAEATERVNRVGALYARLAEVIQALPDAAFRFDRAEQSHPGAWHADDGHGPLLVRAVASKQQLLSLLDDVARQGEGEGESGRSHYQVFVELYLRHYYHAGGGQPRLRALPLAINPTRGDRERAGVEAAARDGSPRDGLPRGHEPRDELTVTRLTHPGARAWALVADEVYRTVLALLAVATSRPLPTEEYTLGREAIAWMHALSAVAQRLVTLPAGTGDLRAGPSFSLPFTLAIPDPASARTAWVGGVLLGLDANLREIARGSLPEEAAELVARLRDGVRATLSALSLPVPKVES
jgi:hypothetical protein